MDEKERNTVFEDMAAYNYASVSVAETGKPAFQKGALFMSASYFPIIGIQPQMGRLFTADEEKRSEWVALLGNAFWREHYASDPKVLGRTIRVNSKTYTIVGVMPPALDDPVVLGGQASVFPMDPFTRLDRENRHGPGWYNVVARLKPGATVEQAQAEMTVIARRLAHDHPKTNGDRGLKVIRYPTSPMGDIGRELTWLVMALSGMVLLIACVNLANLQIVRTTRRGQEIAVRLALGCSRARLVWMFLLDSLIVSVAGGALGMLVAKWSNAYAASFFGMDMPLDLRVIGFTFVVSAATGAVFGTVPAWIASRTEVATSLKAGARGATSDKSRHRLRQGLVVVELSLALTVLAGAGFFVSGIYKVTHRDLGWKADNVLIGFIELDHDHFGEQKDPRSLEFSKNVGARLESMPGIDSVQFGFASPAYGFGGTTFRIEGRPAPEPGKEPIAGSDTISPEFFRVYGIRLVQGRDFRDSDGPASPPVVIVSEAMARKYWPGENPIGKRIGEGDAAKPNWAEVVGVMADYHGAADFYNPSANSVRFMRPWAQNNHRFMGFSVRTLGPPEASKETVQKSFAYFAPDIALSDLETVKQVMEVEVGYFAFIRRLLLQISVLGLLLSAIGIYGVVANLASERTKEVGIRMALGAQPAGIVWLFLRNGIQLALVGTVLGLVASFVLLNILSKALPMLPGNSPAIVVEIAILLIAIAVVACWLPARRTIRIDPNAALREE
jgi:predicted permease